LTASSSAPPATPPTVATIPHDLKVAIRRVQSSPKQAASWDALAGVLLLRREFAQAAAAYQNALRLDPHDEAANLGQAFINMGNGKNRRALTELSGVRRRDPRSSRLWLMFGLAYSKLPQEHSAAISAWSHFLRLSPNSPLTGQVHEWIASLEKGKSAP
jgi:cytochrome c-type biogenesis protein CcmH/NrfG